MKFLVILSLCVVNFLFLQWFGIRIYMTTRLMNGKIVGFGIVSNVLPLTGWSGPYNECAIFENPWIFRKGH